MANSKQLRAPVSPRVPPSGMPMPPCPPAPVCVAPDKGPSTVFDQLINVLSIKIGNTGALTEALAQRLGRLAFTEATLPREEVDIETVEGLMPLKIMAEELELTNRRLAHLLDRLQV